eukprot:scaffold67912_cov20-Prasinocladus_malaysianus.AAC.1
MGLIRTSTHPSRTTPQRTLPLPPACAERPRTEDFRLSTMSRQWDLRFNRRHPGHVTATLLTVRRHQAQAT